MMEKLPMYRLRSMNILAMKNYRQKKVGDKFIRAEEGIDNTFYKKLKEHYPQLKKYTSSQIRGYIVEFNKAMADAIIDNRDGVSLPDHIGNILTIAIGTPTSKRKFTNWKASKEAGKKIVHTNLHSNGYVGHICYIRSLEKYKFPNSEFWWLEIDDRLKNKLAQAFITNWKKYIIAPNKPYVENYIKAYNKEEVIREEAEEQRLAQVRLEKSTNI